MTVKARAKARDYEVSKNVLDMLVVAGFSPRFGKMGNL